MDNTSTSCFRFPQLRFTDIRIDFDQDKSLGQGRFGTVYKAECDRLECAAKYLHCEGATSESIIRMEIQCQLLPTIRHPNLLQCLGTVRHADMNRPIILMELMEENLTNYLLRMTDGVPYYIKVNICHDVALALDYLHSEETIHGSLSSNNVLIAGEGKAKVTDYWMQQLLPLSKKESYIDAYMPPECFQSPPTITKKIDSFSFGVLTIQLDTQRPPQPNKRNDIETERRKTDIEKMGGSSQFKPFAMECLNNDSQLRPTLAALCSRVSVLKNDILYESSIKESRSECGVLKKRAATLETEIGEMQFIMKKMEAKIQQLSKEKDELERKISEKDNLMKRLISHSVQAHHFALSPTLEHTPTSPPQSDEPDFYVQSSPSGEIPETEISIHTEQIGTGNVGTILRATWHSMQADKKEVAFKKFNNQNRSEEWLAKFHLEIQNLCKLQHPNLVKIFGAVGKPHGTIGIAMELVKCNLYQAIIRKTIQHRQTKIVRQIADGLAYLHKKDLPHSNLTSINIFLSVRNTAKIGNYGPKLVRSKFASSYDPVWEDVDKNYAAPELLQSSPLPTDMIKKADVYSLALVAYEVLSSKQPCDEHPLRVPTSGLVAFLRMRNMSKEMFVIITRCLTVDPHKRPSADEFSRQWWRCTNS